MSQISLSQHSLITLDFKFFVLFLFHKQVLFKKKKLKFMMKTQLDLSSFISMSFAFYGHFSLFLNYPNALWALMGFILPTMEAQYL